MSKQERLLILKVAGELTLSASQKYSNPEQVRPAVRAGIKALLKARRQIATSQS